MLTPCPRPFSLCLLCLVLLSPSSLWAANWQCSDQLNSRWKTLEAGELQLCKTIKSARAVVIVNTASLCGYTPQLSKLESLYQRYRERGLLVLGVPTGDFGNQEYRDSARTAQVCHANFGVSFPIFQRGCIRCETPHPLLALAAQSSGTSPKWNFHKTVFDPASGRGLGFPSATDPLAPALIAAVENLLDRPPP